MVNCTLSTPGLDFTRLFISLTAGAGTRSMSLLSTTSKPNDTNDYNLTLGLEIETTVNTQPLSSSSLSLSPSAVKEQKDVRPMETKIMSWMIVVVC